MLFLPAPCLAEIDDWLIVEAENTWLMGMRYSMDENDDNSTSIYATKTLASSATLNFFYSQDQLSDEDNQFDSDTFFMELDVPAAESVNLAINYQFQGQQAELEIERLGLVLSYVTSAVLLAAEFTEGDVYIFTRDELGTNLNIPASINSDFSSSRLSVGWWFEHINITAMVQHYDYAQNIAALQSRPLLQLLVKPSALAQSGLLLASQESISVNIPLQQRLLALHWLSDKSEVDSSRSHAVQLDWSEPISDSSRLILSINRLHDSEDNWSLSAGLEWNG